MEGVITRNLKDLFKKPMPHLKLDYVRAKLRMEGLKNGFGSC